MKNIKKPSTKVVRKMRERCVIESDALEVEAVNLQNDILSEIIHDGDAEYEYKPFGGADKSILQKDGFYAIEDENVSGVFRLESIPSLKSKFFVFINIVTGVRTTFTTHSINDLFNPKYPSSSIMKISDKEVKEYKDSYFKGHVLNSLCSKKRHK